MKSGTRVTDASPTKTRDFTSAWPSSAVAGVRRTCHSGMINVPIDLRESATSEDSRMVGESATMNIIWIIHSTCLGIHLEEACGRMTTER